jgi:predicted phosphohydrolase
MAIWAIGDLHLSFGVPSKHMRIFGPQWEGYTEKIAEAWHKSIQPDDLVLIPGDISWAINLEEALLDFKWIDQLPGTKAFVKGNHDYWWGSIAKLKTILPPSCQWIQNNSFVWQGIGIGGARLWDIPGIDFKNVIDFQLPIKEKEFPPGKEAADLALYQKELRRLENSLKTFTNQTKKRIVMTHYPPIGVDLKDTEVSLLLEKYQVDICVFGHLHNIKLNMQLFGSHNGIEYHLVACDYLQKVQPLRIL